MGLEPTISCLGSKRSTTELHPRDAGDYKSRFALEQLVRQFDQGRAGRALCV